MPRLMFLGRVAVVDSVRGTHGGSAHAAELAHRAIVVSAHATHARSGVSTQTIRRKCVGGQCVCHIDRSLFGVVFRRQPLNGFERRRDGFWIGPRATQFRLQLAVDFPHLSAALRSARRLRLLRKTGMSGKLLVFVHGSESVPVGDILAARPTGWKTRFCLRSRSARRCR